MTAWVRRTRQAWGRTPGAPHDVAAPRFRDEVASALACASGAEKGALPVGAGRSYGESALNPGGRLLDLTGLDRFIAFDANTGIIRAEAGLTLDQLLCAVVPRGWFLATSPGTRFVTLGGAVANDVHGKNHDRAGAFGLGVRRIGLARSDADAPLELAADENAGLFAATIGGLGLTGVILWVELQLVRAPSSYMVQETVPFSSTLEFAAIAAESARQWEWTAAWVDCSRGSRGAGAGLFFRANWSPEAHFAPHASHTRLSLPVTPPISAIRPLTVDAFAHFYRLAHRLKPRTARVHYEKVLYPLDGVGGWNRAYGPAGFRQHQFVVAPAEAVDAVSEALKAVARSGEGSFLTVLKTFGPRVSPGLLSFPMQGVTMAIDFRNRGEATLALFSRLDAIVKEARGRLYPAKDGRIPKDIFRAGYPQWETWASLRDPALQSEFSRKVLA